MVAEPLGAAEGLWQQSLAAVCLAFALVWWLGPLVHYLAGRRRRRRLLGAFAVAHGLEFRKSDRALAKRLDPGSSSRLRSIVVGQWRGREILMFDRVTFEGRPVLMRYDAFEIRLSAPCSERTAHASPIGFGVTSSMIRKQRSTLESFKRNFMVGGAPGPVELSDELEELLLADPGRGWQRDSESVSFVYPAGPGRRFPDADALEREVALLASTIDLTFRTLPLNRIDR